MARLPTTAALELEADTAAPLRVAAVAALVEEAVAARSLREMAASVQALGAGDSGGASRGGGVM